MAFLEACFRLLAVVTTGQHPKSQCGGANTNLLADLVLSCSTKKHCQYIKKSIGAPELDVTLLAAFDKAAS